MNVAVEFYSSPVDSKQVMHPSLHQKVMEETKESKDASQKSKVAKKQKLYSTKSSLSKPEFVEDNLILKVQRNLQAMSDEKKEQIAKKFSQGMLQIVKEQNAALKGDSSSDDDSIDFDGMSIIGLMMKIFVNSMNQSDVDSVTNMQIQQKVQSMVDDHVQQLQNMSDEAKKEQTQVKDGFLNKIHGFFGKHWFLGDLAVAGTVAAAIGVSFLTAGLGMGAMLGVGLASSLAVSAVLDADEKNMPSWAKTGIFWGTAVASLGASVFAESIAVKLFSEVGEDAVKIFADKAAEKVISKTCAKLPMEVAAEGGEQILTKSAAEATIKETLEEFATKAYSEAYEKAIVNAGEKRAMRFATLAAERAVQNMQSAMIKGLGDIAEDMAPQAFEQQLARICSEDVQKQLIAKAIAKTPKGVMAATGKIAMHAGSQVGGYATIEMAMPWLLQMGYNSVHAGEAESRSYESDSVNTIIKTLMGTIDSMSKQVQHEGDIKSTEASFLQKTISTLATVMTTR
ncbi:MAG TPA: hypothetical protein P5048_00075 [Chlamydiales bacterium]|nr:hypothetical protein [Chlamydiales bacterium]